MDVKFVAASQIAINVWMDIIWMGVHVFCVDLKWKVVNFATLIQYVSIVQLGITYQATVVHNANWLWLGVKSALPIQSAKCVKKDILNQAHHATFVKVSWMAVHHVKIPTNVTYAIKVIT